MVPKHHPPPPFFSCHFGKCIHPRQVDPSKIVNNNGQSNDEQLKQDIVRIILNNGVDIVVAVLPLLTQSWFFWISVGTVSYFGTCRTTTTTTTTTTRPLQESSTYDDLTHLYKSDVVVIVVVVVVDQHVSGRKFIGGPFVENLFRTLIIIDDDDDDDDHRRELPEPIR
jgi:hypothetical protein